MRNRIGGVNVSGMKLADLLFQLEAAALPSELWALGCDYFRSYGVEKLSYQYLPPAGDIDAQEPVTASIGYPEHWVRHYVDEGFGECDPIAKYARTAAQPFRWSKIGDLVRLTEKQQQFIDELAKIHDGDGIAIQVYGPRNRDGYFGVGCPRRRDPLGAKLVTEFHWAAQYAHLRFCEMIEKRATARVELSPRETEVLEFVARGKSNSVIGDILGISVNTVDAHLRRIYRKLDVNDRVTASIKGVGSGLIIA
jgi:DNA-binding CsgD family transcriptional regulator